MPRNCRAECSFSLLLLHDLSLTVSIAVLKPALAPQETNAKAFLDLSAWGESSQYKFMYKYCMLCAC